MKEIIALDIGDTLLDRFAKKNVAIPNGGFTYPLFEGVIEALKQLTEQGHQLVIISKINQGDEEKVLGYVRHHNIVPEFVREEDVYFCHEWHEKGPIANKLGVGVIVDDRVEVHNIMSTCGIPHRIIFLGGHDDRDEQQLKTSVIEARNWLDVIKIINSI